MLISKNSKLKIQSSKLEIENKLKLNYSFEFFVFSFELFCYPQPQMPVSSSQIAFGHAAHTPFKQPTGTGPILQLQHGANVLKPHTKKNGSLSL